MDHSTRTFVVAALLSKYNSLIELNTSGPVWKRFFKFGQNAKKQDLWRKLAAIVDWCVDNEEDPQQFLDAQFEMWEGRGEDYPTPRLLGATPLCIKRFYRWKAKQKTFGEEVDTTPKKLALLLEANGLTEEQLFRDPILIMQLPPSAVKGRLQFTKAYEDGAFNDPVVRMILKEYLPNA
jgi:hypothetical protein